MRPNRVDPLLLLLSFASSEAKEEEDGPSSVGLHLRVLRAKVSSEEGAGMDGGKFGLVAFGGGEIRAEICDGRTGEVSINYRLLQETEKIKTDSLKKNGSLQKIFLFIFCRSLEHS